MIRSCQTFAAAALTGPALLLGASQAIAQATPAGATLTINPAWSLNLSGLMDLGVKHVSNPTSGAAHNTVVRGNNNRVTLQGAMALTDGNAVTFGLQHRFEPDTGTLESPSGSTSRPLFQGEARLGLRSDKLGWLRIGRGLTAVQDPNGAYDPYGVATVASLQGVLTAGFSSDPNQTNGAGGGRVNNGIFYASPKVDGMVFRGSFSPTENAAGYTHKHMGVSAEYNVDALAAMAGWERNSVGNTLLEVAGKYNFGPAIGFLGFSHMNAYNSTKDRTGVAVGARVPMGDYVVKAGYGRLVTANFAGDASGTDSVLGVGVDYVINKYAYVYADAARLRTPTGTTTVTHLKNTAVDLGLALTF